MSFSSLHDFIAMGTHGPYVWSSYGLALAVILGLVMGLRQRRRAVIHDIRQKWRREESR